MPQPQTRNVSLEKPPALEALARASAVVASCAPGTAGLEQILMAVQDGFGFGRSALYLVRPGRKLERVASRGGARAPAPAPASAAFDLDLDGCAPTRVIVTGAAVFEEGTESRSFLPLMVPEHVIGVLEVARDAENGPATPAELTALGILASQVAGLVEGRRLQEANEARIEEFIALQRISRQMTSTLDIDELLQTVVEEALRLTGGEGGTLFLLEKDGAHLGLVAWAGREPAPGRARVPVGYGIAGWVARHGKPLRVSDRGVRREEIGYATRKSQLAVPLLSEGNVMGTLAVEGTEEESFSETHEEILAIFAAQAAKAIEAARFFHQIRQERDFRDKILGGTPNGVVALDRSRRVVLINDSARRLLDIHEDPEGNLVERYLPPKAFGEALRKVLEGDAVLESLEVALGRGEEARHVLVSIFAFGDRSERSATLLLQDMTERKRLDDRVQRMGRLASIGQLAAGIAHEIRNPLTGIAISLDLIGEEVASPQGRDLLADVNQEIDRLEALIKGLLDFARPQPVEWKPTSIAKALEWHRTFAEQCRTKGVGFQLEPARSLRLRGDPEKLKQLFLNLALNALDATPAGGEIRVWAEEVVSEGSRWVRVSVQDTGAGMAQGTVAQIFNPFFTTKNEGTGLGLSIAHSIIDQHGGRIDVQSRPGEGSRFTVDLPAFETTEE